MKALVILFFLLIHTNPSIAAEQCGEAHGPIYSAHIFNMNVAKGLGIKTAHALCVINDLYCDEVEQNKYAMEQVFHFMKKFQPGSISTGCKELRAECTQLCKESGAFTDNDCKTNCEKTQN